MPADRELRRSRLGVYLRRLTPSPGAGPGILNRCRSRALKEDFRTFSLLVPERPGLSSALLNPTQANTWSLDKRPDAPPPHIGCFPSRVPDFAAVSLKNPNALRSAAAPWI
ncbi:hypothetical protein EYF80_005555 [Liparis tanakae]|uniref:Uncharacterized protein n=1 Tax=Liparis tanakae TaxID=230148 RepID=A0A4Z2J3G0_9TELE|nr:hypothetical protein EYF80_005555 [Liparis tanakae]